MVLVSNSSIFTLIWGRFPFWRHNIFQWGWNHQLDLNWLYDYITIYNLNDYTYTCFFCPLQLIFVFGNPVVESAKQITHDGFMYGIFTYVWLVIVNMDIHVEVSGCPPPNAPPCKQSGPTVDGRNPAPVDMENIPFSQRLIDNRWCRISSINSIKGLFSTIIP